MMINDDDDDDDDDDDVFPVMAMVSLLLAVVLCCLLKLWIQVEPVRNETGTLQKEPCERDATPVHLSQHVTPL